MKRSEALKPLSRDHHQALYAARQLRRVKEVAAGREASLAFWDEHGREHFRIVEEDLDEAAQERLAEAVAAAEAEAGPRPESAETSRSSRYSGY